MSQLSSNTFSIQGWISWDAKESTAPLSPGVFSINITEVEAGTLMGIIWVEGTDKIPAIALARESSRGLPPGPQYLHKIEQGKNGWTLSQRQQDFL